MSAAATSERSGTRGAAPAKLADGAYAQLKSDICDLRLVPGDRFSEAEVAERLGISRTPVREALFRLQREGYLEVAARSGWVVLPLDFERFDHLFDLRLVLETAALRRLCDLDLDLTASPLEALRRTWLVEPGDRLADTRAIADLDEAFYLALVGAAGNPELARVHREVTERVRIIRRLDFMQPLRIETTYLAHGGILHAIEKRAADEATRVLHAHLQSGKAEARNITLYGLQAVTRATLRAGATE